uniref:Reverse transcriptase domain-containing protein n=1 Tax=Macrostomum lignano TaxID=282301 RepID=A0A1I8IQ35_9PLAT
TPLHLQACGCRILADLRQFVAIHSSKEARHQIYQHWLSGRHLPPALGAAAELQDVQPVRPGPVVTDWPIVAESPRLGRRASFGVAEKNPVAAGLHRRPARILQQGVASGRRRRRYADVPDGGEAAKQQGGGSVGCQRRPAVQEAEAGQLAGRGRSAGADRSRFGSGELSCQVATASRLEVAHQPGWPGLLRCRRRPRQQASLMLDESGALAGAAGAEVGAAGQPGAGGAHGLGGQQGQPASGRLGSSEVQEVRQVLQGAEERHVADALICDHPQQVGIADGVLGGVREGPADADVGLGRQAEQLIAQRPAVVRVGEHHDDVVRLRWGGGSSWLVAKRSSCTMLCTMTLSVTTVLAKLGYSTVSFSTVEVEPLRCQLAAEQQVEVAAGVRPEVAGVDDDVTEFRRLASPGRGGRGKEGPQSSQELLVHQVAVEARRLQTGHFLHDAAASIEAVELGSCGTSQLPSDTSPSFIARAVHQQLAQFHQPLGARDFLNVEHLRDGMERQQGTVGGPGFQCPAEQRKQAEQQLLADKPEGLATGQDPLEPTLGVRVPGVAAAADELQQAADGVGRGSQQHRQPGQPLVRVDVPLQLFSGSCRILAGGREHQTEAETSGAPASELSKPAGQQLIASAGGSHDGDVSPVEPRDQLVGRLPKSSIAKDSQHLLLLTSAKSNTDGPGVKTASAEPDSNAVDIGASSLDGTVAKTGWLRRLVEPKDSIALRYCSRNSTPQLTSPRDLPPNQRCKMILLRAALIRDEASQLLLLLLQFLPVRVGCCFELDRMTARAAQLLASAAQPCPTTLERIKTMDSMTDADPESACTVSLTSAMLKLTERLILWRLLSCELTAMPLSNNQHAFRTGRSTDSALHAIVEKIERAVLGDGYALALFLDIVGAFDNVIFEAFQRALQNRKAHATLIRWIMYMISNRTVTAQLLGQTASTRVCKGGPQGGVLTPTLWNLVMDALLSDSRPDPVFKVGYADDVTAIVAGPSPSTLRDLMQSFIRKAESWANDNGLELSEPKTVAIMFTSRLRWNIRPLQLYGRDIAFAHQTRCLGVTLDHRLNWSFHVKAKAKRASAILAQLRRALGTSWGLSPKRLWWIYTSVVRPAITYASVVWVSATQVKSHADLLNTIQGRACRLICNATRSTPFAGMGAFLNLPPLDLFIRGEAARTTRRLIDAGVKFIYMRAPAKRNLVPHSDLCLNFLNECQANRVFTDGIASTLNLRQRYSVAIDSRDNINDHWNPGELHCYTDGSKQSANTGFGVGIFLNGRVIATHAQYTGVNSSVFQNEVLAISSCTAELLATGVTAWIRTQHRSTWANRTNCRQSRGAVPQPSHQLRKLLLRLSRRDIRAATMTLSGHGCFSRHQYLQGNATNATCSFCNSAMLTVEQQLNGHSPAATDSGQPSPSQSLQQQQQPSEASSSAAGGGGGDGGDKSEDGCDESNADSESRAHKSRDERIRDAKRQYQAERQRRLAELMAAQRQADEIRRRQEAERRKRIEESRRRDAERRRVVEERRRRLEAAEMERRETLLRRLYDRDSRADSARTERRGRSGMAFAFGSSTPRDVYISSIGKSGAASDDDAAEAAAAASAATPAAGAASKRRAAKAPPSQSSSALKAISEAPTESASASSDARLLALKGGAQPRGQQQRKSSLLAGSQPPPRRGVSMTDLSMRSKRQSQVSSAGSEVASSPARKSRPPVRPAAGAADSEAIQGLRRRLRGRQEAATPHRPARQSLVENPASTCRTPAWLPPSPSPRMARQSGPRLGSCRRRRRRPASATSGGGAKASLMTKSMIDLPSAKKVRTKQLFNSTAKSSKRAEAAAATSASATTSRRPPSAASTSARRQPRQVRSRSEPRLRRLGRTFQPAPPLPAVPKSQSAQDLKLSAAAAQQPAAAAAGESSAAEEEFRDTKQVSVSSVLPDVDAAEAKRRFEEQRRLHREKLETEKRADEERAGSARKNSAGAEWKSSAEEARQREADAREAREAEERAEAAAAEERAAAEAQRLKESTVPPPNRRSAAGGGGPPGPRTRGARERQERLAAEEADRIERRKKLEAIMNRVKVGGAAGSPTPDKQPTPAPAPAPTTNENVESWPGERQRRRRRRSGGGRARPAHDRLHAASPAQPGAAGAGCDSPKPPPPPPPQSNASNRPCRRAATSATPVGGSPALSALAGRLKGTKAAEILARHSSQQNLAAAAAAASPAAAALPLPHRLRRPAAEE